MTTKRKLRAKCLQIVAKPSEPAETWRQDVSGACQNDEDAPQPDTFGAWRKCRGVRSGIEIAGRILQL